MHSLPTRWTPVSERDRRAVREELERVLASPQFSASKRYPGFLRYVIEQTLEGKQDIKERTIGIEVFGRPADYDSNNDSVVRYTAGEVRKRLALFYTRNEPSGLQIVLSSRSYVPEFYRVSEGSVLSHGTAEGEEEPNGKRSLLERGAVWLSVALVLLGLGAAGGWLVGRTWGHGAEAASDRFWLPVTQVQGTVLVSPGQVALSPASKIGTVVASEHFGEAYLSLGNSMALARIAALLSTREREYEPLPAAALTLDQIRQNPVVLIGAYNNAWTERLLLPLRFHFAPRPDEAIVDTQHPNQHWVRDSSRPFDNTADYGIVARFRNSSTDSMVVVVAGLQRYGTDAASQFVSSPRFLEQIDRQLGLGWENRNLEAVIRVDVVNGSAGAPVIERLHTW